MEGDAVVVEPHASVVDSGVAVEAHGVDAFEADQDLLLPFVTFVTFCLFR